MSVKHEDPEIGTIVACLTYYSYAILTLFGHIRDFIGGLLGNSRYVESKPKRGYSVLLKSWESFFTRRMYHRIQDSNIEVMERVSKDNNCTLITSGKATKCVNVGSYNYLGYADDWKQTCASDVLNSELEETVARYTGKEAALVTPMGYNTNVVTLAALMGEGTLLVSDNLNHTSLVNGARGSAAHIRVFRSNDLPHLEEVLEEAIVKGQPRHHRPWKKIMVVVEGIYSMEDEAHSIGALGKTGRGSFSGMGGYIAADRKTIDFLRATSEGILYHTGMSPIVTQQIISAFRVIMGEDGTDIGKKKIASLRDNSNYFRDKLTHMGLHVYGDYDSPIIPVMIYMPCKIAAFSRECLKRGLAVVVVGFPATPLVLSRARFCISAGHSREDLDKALAIVEEVVDLLCMRYNRKILG
eukprot:GSChrysophyteH1.ASY1.ANO1.1775.1 assembled CDS